MHINEIRQRPEIEAWLDKRRFPLRRLSNKCVAADGTVVYACDWNPVLLQTDARPSKITESTQIARQSRILYHEQIKRWYVDATGLHKDGKWSDEDMEAQRASFDYDKYGVGEIWVADFGRSWVEESRVNVGQEMLDYGRITSTLKNRNEYTDEHAANHVAARREEDEALNEEIEDLEVVGDGYLTDEAE